MTDFIHTRYSCSSCYTICDYKNMNSQIPPTCEQICTITILIFTTDDAKYVLQTHTYSPFGPSLSLPYLSIICLYKLCLLPLLFCAESAVGLVVRSSVVLGEVEVVGGMVSVVVKGSSDKPEFSPRRTRFLYPHKRPSTADILFIWIKTSQVIIS